MTAMPTTAVVNAATIVIITIIIRWGTSVIPDVILGTHGKYH